MTFDEELTRIIEAAYLHGKESPNLSSDLPDGHINIADAIIEIKSLILKRFEGKEKVINEYHGITNHENQRREGHNTCLSEMKKELEI